MTRRTLTGFLIVFATVVGLTASAAADIEADRQVLAEVDGFYSLIAVSDDGRWIVTADEDGEAIRVRDAETGAVALVNATGSSASISGDGEWVVYSTFEIDHFEIFLWRRATGTSTRLSANATSVRPSIADDGSVVTWLEAGNGSIAVWNRSTGITTDVSTGSTGVALSGDGEYLFYTPTTRRSVRRSLSTGAEVELPHWPEDIANDGESFVYIRPNPGFAVGDGVGIHVIDRPNDLNEITIEDEWGVGPIRPVISGDGSTIIVKARPDLLPLDVNDIADTYRWVPSTGSLDFIPGSEDTVYDVSVDGRVVVGVGYEEAENVTVFFRSTLGEPEAPIDVPDGVAVADLTKPQLTDQVGRLYEAFFLRPPDAGGLAFWVDRRSNGWSVSRMADNFVQSPEFVERYGELGDADFVELIYRNLFDRSPDSSGGPFWTSQLAAGVSRGAVMVEFSESPEYIRDTGTSTPSPGPAHQIWRLYRAYFGRDADQSGFDFWYTIQANGRSLESIADEFAASEEFIAKYGALSNEDFVDIIYRDVLDRSPEPEGRAFWIGQLDNGRSRGSVMTAFSESAEYIRTTGTLPL